MNQPTKTYSKTFLQVVRNRVRNKIWHKLTDQVVNELLVQMIINGITDELIIEQANEFNIGTVTTCNLSKINSILMSEIADDLINYLYAIMVS